MPPGFTPRRLKWDHWELPRQDPNSVILSPLNFGALVQQRCQILMMRNSLYFDKAYKQSLDLRTRGPLSALATYSRACARFADVIVVPSQAMKSMLCDSGFSERAISVLPHPLPPLPQIQGLSPGINTFWSSGHAALLYVGSDEVHKNIPSLARILRGLRDAGIEARLALTLHAGSASLGTVRLKEALKQLNVGDMVLWVGAVDRPTIAAMYRRADVVLAPSFTESYGLAVAESLALGTPVVASDIPAAKEVASEGGARFYDPDRPADAVREVTDLLAHKNPVRPREVTVSWEEYAARFADLASLCI